MTVINLNEATSGKRLMMSLKRAIKNSVIYKLYKGRNSSNQYVKGFLNPAYIENAEKLGLTLADYLVYEAQQNGRDIDHAFFDSLFDRAFKPYIEPHSHILEIGTGAGTITERVIKNFPSVSYFSAEPQEFLASYLQNRFSDYNFTTVYTNGADLAPVSSESMDAVLAYNVFTYLRVSVAMNYFREIGRVLRSGGKAMLHMMNTDIYTEEAGDSYQGYMDKFDDRIPFSKRFLSQHLRRYGLEFIAEHHVDSMDVVYVFEKQ